MFCYMCRTGRVRAKDGIRPYNSFCAEIRARLKPRADQKLRDIRLRWCLELKDFVQENALLEALVRFSYDPASGFFRVGGWLCEFSSIWVHRMTGLPSSGRVPDIKSYGKPKIWTKYMEHLRKRPRFENLLLQMVEDDSKADDFVRLLVCYILSFLLFPNSSGTVARWATKYCDDLDNFREYDWSEAVQRAIVDSIANRRKKIYEDTSSKGFHYLSGFVTLLSVSPNTVLYLEDITV